MTTKTLCVTNSPKPPPEPGPDLTPPPRPVPGTLKPGDPPGTPRPGDPPPSEPKPNSPGPVRPQTLATLLLLLALLPKVGLAQPAADAIDDNDILEAVETDLRLDDAIAADAVDVTVNAGVVTLSGMASTLLAKRRAVRLVASLKGVRAVVDRAKVRPSGRIDEQIFADVQAALRDDPVADDQQIHVTVGLGRVTLKGTVQLFPEKRLAEIAVAGVRGVIEIDNRITINARPNRPDDEIKTEVLRRFELNPYLAEGLIDVQVKVGVVKLSGAVGSVNEKDIAGLLSWVAGVRDVDASNLEIQWWLDRERRRDKFTVLRNDVQLQRAVQDALLYDPRVRGVKIDVRVRQAAVSLLGNVSSLAAKRAAEHDAENTLGVRRVINHLKVKVADWPGDAAVTQRAQQAIARDAHLADFELRAASHFGKVYLRGEVNTHFEKKRADVVAANVPGALDVVNRITVDARWQPKPEDEIEEDVTRRLRWSPFVDADQFTVSVNDGVVTLQGKVDTWQERKTAAQHAHQAGARRVINKLEVRSRPYALPRQKESQQARLTQ